MARLTEQEQQDIIRYIEADKPLPDKYRFLLFEEMREVELVWNGNSPLKKASLTGFHATAKHIAAKAVSPSSETMRTI